MRQRRVIGLTVAVGLMVVPATLRSAVAGRARVARQSPNICIEGTASAGWCGDGGPATAAKMRAPGGVAVGTHGEIYVADTGNAVVRLIGPGGSIRTVAGTGVAGYAGDGGSAQRAQLKRPVGVAVGAHRLLIVDDVTNTVRAVRGGIVTTVAGTGVAGYSGDGRSARTARLNGPSDIAVTPDGGFLIADTNNNRIRRVLADGTIRTVAGNGRRGYSGDGGRALDASLNQPQDVSLSTDGGFFIADTGNNRIRKVSSDGVISKVAGTGRGENSGDGGLATGASILTPIAVYGLGVNAVAIASAGGPLRLVDGHRIIRSVAALCIPTDVARGRDGGFLVPEGPTNRLQRVAPTGAQRTLAGPGAAPCATPRGGGGSPLWDVFDFADSIVRSEGDKVTFEWRTSRRTKRRFRIVRTATAPSTEPCAVSVTERVFSSMEIEVPAGEYRRILDPAAKLPPGDYALRVRGKLADGLTNCAETRLEVR